MKKLILMTLIAALAVPAMAGMTVKIENDGAPGFIATIITSDGLGYNPAAGNSFVTFCIEGVPNPAYFTPGSTYDATIDDVVMYQGGSAAGPLVPPTDATKQMYAAFLNGATSGSGMQDKIWRFEGGLETATDIAFVAGLTDISGWQGVKALNLWDTAADGSQIDIQSQLIRVPAPGAFLLGGIGVAIVGWIKRRRNL